MHQLYFRISGISVESSPDLTDDFEPFKLTPPPTSITPNRPDETIWPDEPATYTEMRPDMDTVRPVDTERPVMGSTEAQKSPKRIPRPMNAFMCWAQGERKRVTTLKPDMHHSEISKILGTRWKMLDPKEKQQYVKQAARLRDLHHKTYPGYKYQPRRNKRTPKVHIFLC